MGDYGDYPDDGYEYDEDNFDGGDRYGLERDAGDRMNTEYRENKTPKDKFIFELSQKYDLYDISEKDKKTIGAVISQFGESQYTNYNITGLLVGYSFYKQKTKANLQKIYENNLAECSKYDIIRYGRLWETLLK